MNKRSSGLKEETQDLGFLGVIVSFAGKTGIWRCVFSSLILLSLKVSPPHHHHFFHYWSNIWIEYCAKSVRK